MGTLAVALVAATLPVLALPTSAGGAAASAAPPTCLGKMATIATAPRSSRTVRVRGTGGADVIVVRGRAKRYDVRALGGDDRICIDTRRPVDVAAGGGDDRIVVRSRTEVDADLGAGDDRFVGGPGPDTVWAMTNRPRGRDVILTRGGDDSVDSHRGPAGRPDRVRLGAGDDDVYVSDAHADPIDLGAGRDQLMILSEDTSPLEVVAASGTARFGSDVIARWRSAETYVLQNFRGGVDFEGTDADERLFLPSPRGDVRMGGGDDELDVYVFSIGPHLLADGGAGHDLLSVYGDERDGDFDEPFPVELNLATSRVTTPSRSWDFTGFDGLATNAPGATYVGDAGPNTIEVQACSATVRAGDGDDTVTTTSGQRGCESGHQLFGEGGDDRLSGGPAGDLLDGGDGDDLVDGAGGDDVCLAERRVACEA